MCCARRQGPIRRERESTAKPKKLREAEGGEIESSATERERELDAYDRHVSPGGGAAAVVLIMRKMSNCRNRGNTTHQMSSAELLPPAASPAS